MNTKKWRFLAAVIFLFCSGQQLLAQDDVTGYKQQIAGLKQQVSDLKYSFDELSKDLDDLKWFKLLDDIAYTDKVRISGLPPAVVRNPTGKGVKNPVTLQAYIFIPQSVNTGKKYPLIILPHGGVHGNFGIGNAHIVKELVVQGYVVVAPEYRGSTGYGKSFERLIDYGGREVDDIKSSRDYMLGNYDFIDKNRVGIVGWSHGGMLTLLNLARFPDDYAVGYAGAPVSDLVLRMGYMNDNYRKLFSADYHLGKEAWQDVENYKRRSPVWNADKIKTPLLIQGNTNDEDVNIIEVEHMVQALKAANKKFEVEIYDSLPGGHHFDRIDNYGAKEIRLKIYRFLEKYLKPEHPFTTVHSLIKASYFPQQEK